VRRQLASCSCDSYRGGAVPGSMLCAKVEGGSTVCMPRQANSGCDSVSVACIGAGGAKDRVHASPAPRFDDAEVDSEVVYLNANLQILHNDVKSKQQLPDAEAFASALAHLIKLPSGKVNVVTEWGKGKVRNTAATAMLHTTFELKSRGKREAVEALLQLTEELPSVGGRHFSVVHVQIFDQATSPLVCAKKAEGLKADAGELLRQLVALKEEEVSLLRRAGETAKKSCDCDSERALGASLGISIP